MHDLTVTVVFSLDGQKGMQLWQFVQRKRNAVIWDNAPRNPILMPRHTLQFAFSGFRFETSLSDVDGNNKSRPSSCRHACPATHTHKKKPLLFLLLLFVCPHNHTTIPMQTHSIRLSNVSVSVSSQIKPHRSVSSIHLVLSVSGVHQVCSDVLILTGKLTWNTSLKKNQNKPQKASPGFPGKVWIIGLSGRQSW